MSFQYNAVAEKMNMSKLSGYNHGTIKQDQEASISKTITEILHPVVVPTLQKEKVKKLENVQERGTRMLKNMIYHERLKQLNLFSLSEKKGKR